MEKLKLKFMEKAEPALISEGMIASLCMAVMIRLVSKQRITVRDFAGWTATVKPAYILPLPKSFPPATDTKTSEFDEVRATRLEKPAEKRGLLEGAPALLVMPVVVTDVYPDVLIVANAERQYFTVLPRDLHVLPAYFPFSPDRKQESIYLAPGSEADWTCVCGNDDEQRFYYSDIRGNELNPSANGPWKGYWSCEYCGRVFHQDKLIIVDQNSRPCFLHGDEPSRD